MDKEVAVKVYSGYYSAKKHEEILPFMTTWVDPEGIKLSEVSLEKDKDCYDITYCGS